MCAHTMKAMKATAKESKDREQAKQAMATWAVACQTKECTSWAWLWKPCLYQFRCQMCKRHWSKSLPKGLHQRQPGASGYMKVAN